LVYKICVTNKSPVENLLGKVRLTPKGEVNLLVPTSAIPVDVAAGQTNTILVLHKRRPLDAVYSEEGGLVAETHNIDFDFLCKKVPSMEMPEEPVIQPPQPDEARPVGDPMSVEPEPDSDGEEWACSVCTYLNSSLLYSCGMCGTGK
jgi:hypothetical protein